MQLSLRSLQDAHEHFEKQYKPALFPRDRGRYIPRGLAGVALVRRRSAGNGAISRCGPSRTELELTCSRCLEPFTLPVATDFDLRYVPRTENVGEGEKEVEEDDLATAFYSNDQIDLGHLIVEQLQLAVPMKPLCDEACKGLCPQCGTNLNTGSCDCSQAWEDPRLAALRTA